ncbi:thiamine pyrophosphate-dependent acetolactate synthase large subunit-like protein [Bradyrhizobium sp. F1.13.4]
MNSKILTVREATLGVLRSFSVDRVFGNPGSTELAFLGDWPDDIDYVLGLQEACVVGMADGYAQATGRPAFVNLHSAAGLGHALGNLFTAFRNKTPMVVTAGQQARSLLRMRPYLFSEDAAQFPKPYVKMERRTGARRRCSSGDRAGLPHRHAASARSDIRVGAVG